MIYVVGRGRTIHEVRLIGRARGDLEGWITPQFVRTLPDFFFVKKNLPEPGMPDGIRWVDPRTTSPIDVLAAAAAPDETIESNLP